MPETSKELAVKVTFPSLPSASYRLVVESHRIWVEHNTTREQWECMVEDASKYARKGACVEHDKVMECLGAALVALAEHRPNNVHVVDAVPLQGDRFQIELVICFDAGGIKWRPEFEFILEPLEVSENDILRSQMRDMQERLVELEEQLANVPGTIVVGGNRADHAKAEESWRHSMEITMQVLGRIASFMGSTLRDAAALMMRLLVYVIQGISSMTEPGAAHSTRATSGSSHGRRVAHAD